MVNKVSIIVAAAENNIIGKNNDLPWHIPEDFKYFKDTTSGKPCVMGRKTYESILGILGKPLPNRPSIVISRSGYEHDGATSFNNIAEGLAAAQASATELGVDEVMMIGGAQIYKQALEENLVDRIYLTRVHQNPEGDAYFPELDENIWQEVSRDDRDGFSFLIFERR